MPNFSSVEKKQKSLRYLLVLFPNEQQERQYLDILLGIRGMQATMLRYREWLDLAAASHNAIKIPARFFNHWKRELFLMDDDLPAFVFNYNCRPEEVDREAGD